MRGAPRYGFRGVRRGSGRHLDSTGDLVRKTAKGDERAWSELVCRFGPMVLGVARRAGLNAADAADVQQATWVQLMRYGDQVRDPDRVGAWLATTARRQSQRVAMTKSRQVLSVDPLMQGGSAMAAPTDDVADVVVHDQYEPVLERADGPTPGPLPPSAGTIGFAKLAELRGCGPPNEPAGRQHRAHAPARPAYVAPRR